jgi:gliding motility-associated-like protein
MILHHKIFLVTLLSSFSFLMGFSQNFTLNSQADVDAFDSSITIINGFLIIETTSVADPIVNLATLSNLTAIGVDLEIKNNPGLINLDELANLTLIGGDLKIVENDALLNIDGLQNLSSLQGNMILRQNNELTNVDGFANIISTEGFFNILHNDALTNIDGLNNLISTGYMSISGNSNLTNVDGLSNLTSTSGNFSISFSEALTNIDGIANLTLVGGDMFIGFNDILPNIDALENLTYVGGEMQIRNNYNLTNLDGLTNITTIGGNLNIAENTILTNLDGLIGLNLIWGHLWLYGNPALTDIEGLTNINSIEEYLIIHKNESLTNLNGLSNLTSIGDILRIQENNALTNINGLVNLSSIDASLYISENNALTNIDGLTNLISIGDNLSIHDNSSLTNLNGLSGLNSIAGNLYIRDNLTLTNCCGIQELLATPGAIEGSKYIYNNPSECSSIFEVLESVCLDMFISVNVPCIGTDNGSIQIQIIGGISPFTFILQEMDGEQITGTTNDGNFILENLSAGTYNLTVTDIEGTEFFQDNIALTPLPGSVFEIIEITTTNSSNEMSNGAIHLTVNGGTTPYTLSWTGSGNGSQTDISSSILTIDFIPQGVYEITISDDIGNQQTVSITLLDETVPVFPCTQPLDIVVLNDVSASVDVIEYSESKQFFSNFLSVANIGLGMQDSRATIIEWSGATEQSIQIPMTGNLTELQSYVNYSRAFEEGSTNPHEALSFGKNYLTNTARPDAERVLILSTDGHLGQISPSLAELADEFKAAGYHIITIAFDNAYSEAYTRHILQQAASIDLLAPGAPAYSLLDQDLAENIVNIYLCPIDPGSSGTAYFNRDGAINIIGIETIGDCPYPENIDLTFTIEALRELSIPSGTPVTFYYNDPALFGATSILTWYVPCTIPAGTTETFTVNLPVTEAANIFASLNNDDSQSTPIAFPITDIDELAWSNNTSDTTFCLDPLPTLQALKFTTTPIPICNNTVIYTVTVCNITDMDATGVTIMDIAPDDFVLLNTVVNDNGCSLDNDGSFDIPGGCCVSITYTYDATDAAYDNYNDQDVYLSGPPEQVYLNFDGATSSAEDVLIDGNIDCPSTVINFTKEVNVSEICEDAFVVYTFTIDNQLNIPLHGLVFSDTLSEPVHWVFQPYGLQGLSIGNSSFEEGIATFIIDEVAANTVASFSIDAALGNWSADGVLNNTASLENVPSLETGSLQTITSNTVTTIVKVKPEIEVSQSFNCSDNSFSLTANLIGQANSNLSWLTAGDGTFNDSTSISPLYSLGPEELSNNGAILSVTAISECGEITEFVAIELEITEPTFLDLETCEGETIEYNGTFLSAGETQDFVFLDSNGCDSIVTVSVMGLPGSAEELTLVTCEGETVDYNGTSLAAGTSQDFFYQNNNGCDSVVTVSVMGLAGSVEELTLETCEGETVDYNGTSLVAGITQDFIYQNNNGCDSVVTVSVMGLAGSAEQLTLETCESETVDYNGTTLVAGTTQDFIFQNSNGCDSIITVTVIGNDFSAANNVPNAFSPNGDNINDCFHPFFSDQLIIRKYKLQIFNRWGGLIFSTADLNECWQGQFNGRPANSGVYVWVIELTTDNCDEKSTFSGSVTLVR